MPETDLKTSEASIIPSETSVTPSEATVILSETKDRPPLETPTDDDTLELVLEEELIIEDFTIDGICGVY